MVLLSARIRIIHSLLCFFTIISLNAAEVIKGSDAAPEGATFAFPVDKIVKDAADDVLFIGARNAGAGVFAFSGLHPSNPGVQPLAPEKVQFNNEKDQDNPLFNQGIALLDLLEATDGRRAPIMVTTGDPTRVYLIKEFAQFNNMSIFATAPLFDANAQITQKIVGIVGFRGGIRSAALAAVTPNTTGIFGDAGSGFTTITYQQYEQQVPAEGTQAASVKVSYTFTQISGVAFNRLTENVSKIGNPATSFSNTVSMLWSRPIQRGYIGLQVVGGAAGSDGARSIVIAVVNDAGGIMLRQFAPDSAFDAAGDQIIGGLGASIPLSVHEVTSMETSTGLSYLIVQGGNGDPGQTNGSVYALPIVNARNRYGQVTDEKRHGVLASKDSRIFNFYDGLTPSRFLRRIFVDAATTPAQTPRADDAAAKVGGGPIETGVIEAVNVVSDAVIVSVSEISAYGPCATGMYISRPMYEASGRIKGWTRWQRMGGAAEPVFHTEVSYDSGNVTYFTGDDYTSVNTIKRTAWGLGSAPGLREFAETINALYLVNKGGVQGLVDIPFNAPGLNGISLLATTGFGMVTLTETGIADSSGTIECPNTGEYITNARVFENGTISETPSGTMRMVTVQGGALDVVGPVVTAAVGVHTSANQGYLFVGGSRGLAVLTKPNGNGWDTTVGLGPNFAGLTSGMAFRILGSYQFVRNLVVDGNFLYVVTASRVDRIDLSSAPTFTATTIASKDSLVFDKNDTILDGIFSGKLGILATSKGLFRTSNGNNVSAVATDSNMNWSTVPVPAGVVPPQQFFVSSTTGLPTDFARADGGMIHLLSAYLGSNRARINRFSINDVSVAPIDDATVQPLDDGEIEGVTSSFITFNGFRTSFTTDGALALNTVGRTLLISPYIRTRGFRNGFAASLGDGNGTLIEQVLRSSASGSWLVAGDFGIRINE